MRRPLFMGVALLAMASLSFGDTLILRNGNTRSGRFVSGSQNSIVFQDDTGGRRTYNRSEIQSIQFTGTALGSNPNWGVNTDSGTSTTSAAAGAARTVPAGTDLVIRTNETIEGDESIQGRTFSAQVDRDIRDASGNVVVPRGSDAELVVRSAADDSKDVVIDLQSVRVNNQRYLISAAGVEQEAGKEGIGANRRTATMVGGGAVLGTLLGAIAGGGKGAAIGAIAGAAAGAGAQVLTRGKEVKVPAESTLTFRLDQPVRLVPQSS
ncbi:MAG TPA: hypothetical protein VN428_24500 [Bryobacteraceae bacterium]|nr:hypothetical protein [Bryobacteraceae bacterium]